METKFQTSFIPKTTIAPTSGEVRPRRQTSFLIVISFFAMLVSVLLGGLAFGYNKLLENKMVTVQADLQKNIQAFEPNTIRGYADLDTRMDTAKQLLEKHIALSYFLEFLGAETLKSVRFMDMSYELGSEGKVANLSLHGIASGYNAVAYQSNVFGSNTNLKNPVFSNLDLDKEGNVVFDLSFDLDPTFVYYKKKAADYLQPAPTTAQSGEEGLMRVN